MVVRFGMQNRARENPVKVTTSLHTARPATGHGSWRGAVCSAVLLSLPLCGRAEPAATNQYRITGANVNLRARPSLKAEWAGQAQAGSVVEGKGVQGTWLEIVPPDTVDLWVYGDFIEQGRTAGARVNVRTGPGLNYREVGKLARGQTVTVRGSFGDWVKIAPPADCSLWVHNDYVEPILPPPAPKPTPTPETRVLLPRVAKPQPHAIPKRAAPPAPADLTLVPLKGQGTIVTREGTLRRAGFMIGRPSKYRLVRQKNHRIYTLCYVKGSDAQLRKLLGRKLSVQGREYWVQGGRYPVLVPQQIQPK